MVVGHASTPFEAPPNPQSEAVDAAGLCQRTMHIDVVSWQGNLDRRLIRIYDRGRSLGARLQEVDLLLLVNAYLMTCRLIHSKEFSAVRKERKLHSVLAAQQRPLPVFLSSDISCTVCP